MDRQNTSRLLDETFSSDFDINRFAKFVKELFNNFTIIQKTWTVWQEYSDYIESYVSLGSYTDKSKKVIDVLAVKLKRTSSRDRARTMQRNFIAKYLSNAEKDAALVAFYGDDEDWRFSFVKMEYNLIKDEEGKAKVAKELTPAKRYSFLVGKNEPNHTCKRQFLELVMEDEINPSIVEIESAFSIDNVTKEFFLEYKELFLELEESLQKVISKDKHVKEEFESKGISFVDFAKKLLGQIVFIYFLQKKGWLGVKKGEKWGEGPKDFMRCLLGGGPKNLKPLVPYKNFFNEILEPLFYEALANDRSADDHFYRLFNCKIPFLNGGLFEPINEYKWAEIDITIDNAIFDRILSTFDRFNFTVKEDEPLEKEVAVDPEMLGKVFENLLEVKDRKSKGAFYTPREIVHYMCQQSLINYLETNSSIAREDIENFIQLGDFALAQIIKEQEQIKKYGKSYDINEKFSIPKSIKENHLLIDKLLKEIKIVDPAVGSGAFPVGMMNEIVKARSILSIFFKEERKNYDLKREIIENCLYGVDIEPSAVEITKLRFWLSLIVDELDMKNIKPLPNLDHKIMCGNSLLEEFEGVKLFDDRLLGEVKKDYSFEIKQIDEKIASLYKEKGDIAKGKKNGLSLKDIEKEIKKLERKKEDIKSKPKENERNLTLGEISEKKIKESQKKLSQLKKLQKEYFDAQNRKVKKQLREDIDRIEWELIEETLKEQGNEEAMQKLKQYKKNKAKPFFLWKLYFAEVFQRENPGFDVVIANPPYISYYSNTGNELSEYEKEYFVKSFQSVKKLNDRLNSMNLFAEKGIMLLRNNATMSYIVNKTLAVLPSYESIREVILNDSKIDYLITNLDPFEAIVDCIVFGLTKQKPLERYNLKFYKGQISKYQTIDIFIFRNNSHLEFHYSSNQNILSKMDKNDGKLSDLIIINRGVNIGGCFSDFLSKNKVDNNYYKYLSGTRSVDKFYYKWNPRFDCYFVFDLEKERKLRERGETLVLGDPKRYLGKKLFIPESGQYIMAAYVEEKIYSAYGLMVGTSVSSEYDLKYSCALLNSKLITFYCIEKEILRKGNKATPHVGVKGLNSVPVKLLSKDNQKPFIQLVDKILSITKDDDYLKNPDKQAKVKKMEKEIDQLVYKLYELTPDEIKIVEEFGKGK